MSIEQPKVDRGEKLNPGDKEHIPNEQSWDSEI